MIRKNNILNHAVTDNTCSASFLCRFFHLVCYGLSLVYRRLNIICYRLIFFCRFFYLVYHRLNIVCRRLTLVRHRLTLVCYRLNIVRYRLSVVCNRLNMFFPILSLKQHCFSFTKLKNKILWQHLLKQQTSLLLTK